MEKNIRKEEIFHRLQLNKEHMSKVRMESLFLDNPKRAEEFCIRSENLFFDYSKNTINKETMSLLLSLADACDLKDHIKDMMSGKKINFTEQRAVLHTALRSKIQDPLVVDGVNVRELINEELKHMQKFSDAVRSGEWTGINGNKITDVVNIGIGGSYLGPDMVCNALKAYSDRSIKMHFVSNVDGADLAETLMELNAETTLFIVASKTFTTKETIMNANSAKAWFVRKTGQEDISKNFVALSTNTEEVANFGIDTDNMFKFWDWVGGRYSVWSAIGLPIAISVGMDNFYDFLDGGYKMDYHFEKVDFDKNIPVVMALLGYWYNNLWNMQSYAVLPYSQYLCKLPAYLQQLDMESNGKRITSEGHKSRKSTGPIIFGEAGTNGQHSFYQLLHQGTKVIPADFISFKETPTGNKSHHRTLLSNFIAQTEALMIGKPRNVVRQELKDKGASPAEIERVIDHKVFEGNRPSNSILFDKLTPFAVGQIIAMYEHKVFVQGVLWDVNSFDQWGVELGKVLATKIENELKDGVIEAGVHDSSTVNLLKEIMSN